MVSQIPKDLKVSRKVLLTGAGFTRDFGGYLAKEMWDHIFNDQSLTELKRIKELTRKDFSYESIFNEVISGNYSLDEKETIRSVVQSAYDSMDKNIRNNKYHKNKKADSVSVATFIRNFREHRSGSGEKVIFFTLNQDLFVERYCYGSVGFSTPGVVLQGINQDSPLAAESIRRLPDPDEVSGFSSPGKNPLAKHDLHYVKLHGSYHWRNSAGGVQMVIGKAKSESIRQEPLLAYYFDLFKFVLSSGGIDLLVIGYGFKDEHVNQAIVNAIENHGLRLFVVNPGDQDTFIEGLRDKPHVSGLWDSLKGYFPYAVSEIFPPGNSPSQAYARIERSYFEK